MKEKYGKLEYNGREYLLAFNLNVMENIQDEYGSVDAWAKLIMPEGEGESNAKAVKFGFTEMINEGIDIRNEENGTDDKPMTLKQVGRLITNIGLEEASHALHETVTESTHTEDDGKNV